MICVFIIIYAAYEINSYKMRNSAPVSALAVKDNKVYCGLGGHLHVYDVRSKSKLVSSLVLKDGSCIRGFDFRDGEALTFGGKSVAILDTKSWKIKNVLSFKDWIMIAKFDENYDDGKGDELYLGFAHNFVRFRGLERWCSARCLLYSMAFYLTKSDDLIVASGTVFGDIIVWNPKTMTKTITLQGHDGSIFGVVFSGDGTQLCTISDDRTVRLWNLETGSLMWKQFGHKARIWDVTFLGTDRVVTVSEDSTCRVWNRDNGECVSTWTGHSGYHAWSVATNAEGTFVVSGGSDGAVGLKFRSLFLSLSLSLSLLLLLLLHTLVHIHTHTHTNNNNEPGTRMGRQRTRSNYIMETEIKE